MCVWMSMHLGMPVREYNCVCVFYKYRSSLFVIDRLVPYLSLCDPVLKCWHPLFTSCLQQTHVVRAGRKGKKGWKRDREGESIVCPCASCQQDLPFLFFLITGLRVVSDYVWCSSVSNTSMIPSKKEKSYSSLFVWLYFLKWKQTTSVFKWYCWRQCH